MVLGHLNFERMFVMKLEQLKELSEQVRELNSLRKEAMVILENLLKNESEKVKNRFCSFYHYDDFRFYFTEIDTRWVYYRRDYGYDDFDTISIEFEGLASDTRENFWKSQIALVNKELVDQIAKKKADVEKAQKAKKTREREEYERLKKKFEKELDTA